MPNYFNRINRDTKDVFYSDYKKIGDDRLDLPSKLTILFKRGIGKKYIAKPRKLDAPLKKQHQEYLSAQFMKATYDRFIRATTLEIDRRKSFEDFTVMDYTPEISSALDIYADESLTKNEDGKILGVSCENVKIKKVLENLFEDILDVNHELWAWTREACKFGNHFLLLDVQPNRGVVGFLPLPTEEIRREEAYDGNINSVKFLWDTNNLMFDNWQIAHFRMMSDQKQSPYGTSELESTRLIWKQLQLAEDAMLIYRCTRAPERRVFYIDVGNIDPGDVATYIQTVKNEIKRQPQVKESTGNIDFKFNSMAVDEDFFIPRRGDKNSEVDSLPGASNLDEIADIEYLQQKMFASLKIPKAYLTFDEQINAKATLASEDFRFARTINRIQQAILTTLNKIAIIHLYALGYRDKEQLTGFELELTNPSTQSEIEKMEILQQKASVFKDLWDESTLSPISYVWGMKNIFDFSDKEIKNILQQQFLEGKMKLEIENVSQSKTPEGGAEGMPSGEGGPPESSVQDESGNELPETPPEGYGYIDTESGMALESRIDAILKTLNQIKKPKGISNKMLLNNSLSYDNNKFMLFEMQNRIETRSMSEKRLINEEESK